MKSNEAAFENAVEWLGSAKRVVVFTGAGVSAESGIPTFRDQLTGLWAKFDPAQLATPDAFRNDPGLVWGWYEWRRALAAAAKPNPAHIAIAALARYVPELMVVTQNVDDLHERAGSEHVVHLHGSLQAARCFACARPYSLSVCASPALTQSYVEPPRCAHFRRRVFRKSHCGMVVVLFISIPSRLIWRGLSRCKGWLGNGWGDWLRRRLVRGRGTHN